MRLFSKKYKITEKTILKYLRNNNIPYRNKRIKITIPKDKYGRYSLKLGKNEKIHLICVEKRFQNSKRNNLTAEEIAKLIKIRSK